MTAAKLANGFADAYVEQQRDRKWQATHDAEVYLKSRIADLQRQVAKSDQAVEDYRRSNGLFKGATSGVTEQQLGELNTQLILAQTGRPSAKAKLTEACAAQDPLARIGAGGPQLAYHHRAEAAAGRGRAARRRAVIDLR